MGVLYTFEIAEDGNYPPSLPEFCSSATLILKITSIFTTLVKRICQYHNSERQSISIKLEILCLLTF